MPPRKINSRSGVDDVDRHLRDSVLLGKSEKVSVRTIRSDLNPMLRNARSAALRPCSYPRFGSEPGWVERVEIRRQGFYRGERNIAMHLESAQWMRQ